MSRRGGLRLRIISAEAALQYLTTLENVVQRNRDRSGAREDAMRLTNSRVEILVLCGGMPFLLNQVG